MAGFGERASDRGSGWFSGAGLEDLVGPAAYPRTVARAGAALVFVGAAGNLASLVFYRHPDPDFRVRLSVMLLLSGLAIAAAVWRLGPRWPVGWLTVMACVLVVSASVGVGFAGPGQQQAAVAIPAMSGPLFFFFPRRVAAFLLGLSLGVYALILGLDQGYPNPVTRWGMAASVSVASAVVMSWISDRLRVLAVAERRSVAEVARLNGVLSERVNDLGRFLAPHVAAAVRDAGDRTVLEPHRRQISVLFVDLRGFTGFTAGAEPEDVVEVLTEYYTTVGDLAHRFDASIGGFIGDAVMAYLGDPLVVDDPVGSALAMAFELRRSLDDLTRRWRARGYRLGYGIGIAYGYATLGVVGYEGRRDYTALGTVVNLASRLCGEAADGEIVLDPRSRLALDPAVATEARTIAVKGFADPVPAHVISPPTI